MVAVGMSATAGMLRLSAIWQSGSIPITAPDKASRRLFETRSSRKSGTKLTVSIKESRDRLRRLDRHLSGLCQACAAVDLGQVCASRHAAQADGESSFRLGALRPQS